jgi:hypothetical protein
VFSALDVMQHIYAFGSSIWRRMQLFALEVVAGDRREVVLKVQKNGGVGEGVRRSDLGALT